MQSVLNLECDVCLNLYQDPRILPCGHTFCLKCVQNTKERSCNSCHKSWSEHYTNVRELPKNLAIESLVNSLPSISKCSISESDDHGPVKYLCINCWDPLCDDCGKSHTKYNKITKHHVIKPIRDISQAEIENHARLLAAWCSLHKNENNAYYCTRCETTACDKCLCNCLSNANFISITEAEEMFQSNIKKAYEKLKAIKEEYDLRLQRSAALKIQLSDFKCKLKADVTGAINNVKQMLQTTCETLMKEVDKRGEGTMSDIMNLIDLDILQLDYSASETHSNLMTVKARLQICEQNMTPVSSVIEQAHFIKLLKSQPVILDKCDESNKSLTSLDKSISIWNNNLTEWTQTTMDSLQILAHKAPWLIISDNDDMEDEKQMLACANEFESIKNYLERLMNGDGRSNFPRYNMLECKEHENQQIELYCLDCKQCACRICASEQHEQHDCLNINAADQKIINRLQKLSKKLNDMKLEYSKELTNMFQMKMQLNESYAAQEGEFNHNVDELKLNLKTAYEKLAQEFENQSKKLKSTSRQFSKNLESTMLKMELNLRQIEEMITLIEKCLLSRYSISVRVDITLLFTKQLNNWKKLKESTFSVQFPRFEVWKNSIVLWLQPAIDQLTLTANSRIKRVLETIYKTNCENEEEILNLNAKCEETLTIVKDTQDDKEERNKNCANTNRDNKGNIATDNEGNIVQDGEDSANKEHSAGDIALKTKVCEAEKLPPSLITDEDSDRMKSQISLAMWNFLNNFYSDALREICHTDKVFEQFEDYQEVRGVSYNAMTEKTQLNLAVLINEIGAKTMPVSLSALTKVREIAVVEQMMKLDHRVTLTKGEKENSYYITGCVSDLKIAIDRLDLLNITYQRYKQPIFTFDKDIVNIYSTIEPSLPLIISEPNRVFWQVFSASEEAVNIIITAGDLLQQNVKAIVNASHPKMQYRGGISLIIRQSAGMQIEDEGIKWLKENGGKIKTTHNAVTSAGKLPFQYLIHAVGPNDKMTNDESECIQPMIDTFINCFSRGDELNVTSLAMPALSSGKLLLITCIYSRNMYWSFSDALVANTEKKCEFTSLYSISLSSILMTACTFCCYQILQWLNKFWNFL